MTGETPGALVRGDDVLRATLTCSDDAPVALRSLAGRGVDVAARGRPTSPSWTS